MPRKLRGREAREWEARAAQEAAVQAFYRMDRAQRDALIQVEAFANLGEDAAGAARLRAEFAELGAQADLRAQRYLATLDANPLEDDTPAGALGAATAAFTTAAGDVGAMADQLEAFLARHAGEFARIDAALARLTARTAAATAALAAARDAAAALAAEGIAAGQVDAALADAEAAAADLAKGAAVHGVAGATAQAERVTRLAAAVAPAADAARTRAVELSRRREEVTRRLVSLRTRREALENQGGAIPDVLRELRRAYVEGCWADLADAPARFADLLAAADGDLDRAREAARAADWERGVDALARTVGRLDAAADLATAVHARRAALEEVRKDPAARLAAARFHLRDAQRLVMTGRTVPPQPWAGELDAIAARLERVGDLLAGVHPNYWAFLTELTAITDATTDVVRRFRTG